MSKPSRWTPPLKTRRQGHHLRPHRGAAGLAAAASAKLVQGALDQARASGLKVIAECPRSLIGKHPEYRDLRGLRLTSARSLARCGNPSRNKTMAAVRDNKARQRFELDVEDQIAFANYRQTPQAVIITQPKLRGACAARRCLGAGKGRAGDDPCRRPQGHRRLWIRWWIIWASTRNTATSWRREIRVSYRTCQAIRRACRAALPGRREKGPCPGHGPLASGSEKIYSTNA